MKISSLLSRCPTRLRLLATMLAGPVLAAAASDAHAQQTLLRLGYFPNVTHAHALVARYLERQGRSWFAERLGSGVKIEWYVYNAGPGAMEAIFTRSLDMTYVGPSPALNAYVRSRGDEIRVVAGAVYGASALIVQSDSGLTKPSDFRGKRIATPQFGNTQDVATRAWLASGGLRITQTGGDAYVVPTANPDQLALFQRKQLDAVWTVEPWVSRLELEAGGNVLVDEKEAVTTILVARKHFLESQRDLTHRVVAANRELTEWMRKNPAEAQRIVREELKALFGAEMSADLIARSWSRMTLSADISLTALRGFVTGAQQVGFLRAVPDLSRLVETP